HAVLLLNGPDGRHRGAGRQLAALDPAAQDRRDLEVGRHVRLMIDRHTAKVAGLRERPFTYVHHSALCRTRVLSRQTTGLPSGARRRTVPRDRPAEDGSLVDTSFPDSSSAREDALQTELARLREHLAGKLDKINAAYA